MKIKLNQIDFKKTVLLLLLTASLLPFHAKSQYYISVMPAFYTTAGNTSSRVTADIELGRQWKVFSLGLDIGKTNFNRQEGKDSTWYAEARSNLNVFQQEKFTNTITIGCGYVHNAKENIMFEATTGIEFDVNHHLSMNIYFGSYYFSGKVSASQRSFFGLSLVHFFGDRLKAE